MDYGHYTLQVSCFDIDEDLIPQHLPSLSRYHRFIFPQNASYLIGRVPYLEYDDSFEQMDWIYAERLCEQMYQSTLAVITSTKDMLLALKDIQQQFPDFDKVSNISFCIGLNRIHDNYSSWAWIDGTPWSVTTLCVT